MTLFHCLAAALLLLPLAANSEEASFSLRVLSAESREFQAPPVAPIDCNWRDYSAYCLNASPETYVENTMTVQATDGKTFQISCVAYNQWSNCTTLPIDNTFKAKPVKRGLEIRYVDTHNKLRKQLYTIVGENPPGR